MPILIPTNSFVKQQFIKNKIEYSADINADLYTCLIGASESHAYCYNGEAGTIILT